MLSLAVAGNATALAFGNLALGQQEDLSLQLTNTGNGPVTFAPVINGPSFTVPTSENGCGTVIPSSHNSPSRQTGVSGSDGAAFAFFVVFGRFDGAGKHQSCEKGVADLDFVRYHTASLNVCI